MEASAITELRTAIENFQEYQDTVYNYLGQFKKAGCCDFLKTNSSENYKNVKLYLPLTEYTQWWLDNWIEIFPEIKNRVTIEKNVIILNPHKGRWQQQHFIWTLLRMSYNNNLGYRLYKSKTPRFLEGLRFFLFISPNNHGRFITETKYFNPNIEKARKVFEEDLFKRMYNVFSGNIHILDDKDFLKDVKGLENRIDAVNKHFKKVDELSNEDLSGSNLFRENDKVLKLIFYLDKPTFRDIRTSRDYKDINITSLIDYKDVIHLL